MRICRTIRRFLRRVIERSPFTFQKHAQSGSYQKIAQHSSCSGSGSAGSSIDPYDGDYTSSWDSDSAGYGPLKTLLRIHTAGDTRTGHLRWTDYTDHGSMQERNKRVEAWLRGLPQ